MHDFLHPDRIVIGCEDPRVGGARVSELYRGVHAPVLVTDPASAEMIKYASNAFLATKVSFINAIANLCEAVDADVREVAIGMGYDTRIGFQFLHPGSGLRRVVLPEGRRRAAAHRGRRPATTSSCSRRRRRQPRAARAHGRQDPRPRSAARSPASTVAVVGPHVQGRHRRPARLARARRRPPRCSRRARPCGRTTRSRATGRAELVPELDAAAPTPTTRRPAPTSSRCSPSGTSSAGSTSSGCATPCAGRAIVDARNLLDPAAMRRRGFEYHGSRAADEPDRRHRRRRVRRLAPLRRVARTRRRGRRGRQPLDRPAARTSRTSSSARDFELVRRRRRRRASRSTGRVDGVLHFASPASPPEYLAMPLETLDVSSIGTRRALDLARGQRRAVPARVDQRDLRRSRSCTRRPRRTTATSTPIGPRAVYDEAKRFAETLTMTYHRLYGLPTRDRAHLQHLRAAPAPGRRPGRLELPGAGDRREAADDLRHAAPRPARSATSTTRCAGIMALFDSDVVEPVNIGNPIEFTMLELAEVVREVTGVELRLRVRAAAARRPDPAPARHHAGAAAARLGADGRNCAKGSSGRTPGTWRSVPVVAPDRHRRRSCASSRSIVPVYNERNTLVEVLRRMRAVELPDGIEREIIVVDDGSTDGTRDVLRQLGDSTVRVVMHDGNRGKGAAVRTGIEARDRRLRPHPGRRPRVRPRRLAEAARTRAARPGPCRVRLAVHR